MIQGCLAIYYRELMIMKRRLPKMIATMSVSPLLYLIAFGYAMGHNVKVDGHTYLEFLLPGLVAMSSMTQAFSIASEINIARFYWHIFEEFQSAPISNISYVCGEILAGMTRAFMSIIIILILGYFFGVSLSCNILFWLAIILNSFIFASLAVGMAMLVKSHADQAMFSSFVITPMAFLGGTLFPVDRLPLWAQKILFLLPLTHASKAIRTASFGNTPDYSSYIILFLTGVLFIIISFMCVNRARD
ncbi:MAG: ABC transporter permease [Desulfosarcina sp.]|nr:ABC transporter permease [Desulfobacterales bacterium]